MNIEQGKQHCELSNEERLLHELHEKEEKQLHELHIKEEAELHNAHLVEEEVIHRARHNEAHELSVEVRYNAAARPFIQEHVPRVESVGQLLADVLQAFGLTPGQTAYNLRYQGRVLENLHENLGQLAGCEHRLCLTLGHQLING